MRLFVYEENEDIIADLAKKCNTTPTKYLNVLVGLLNQECHKEMTGIINDKIKESSRGRKRKHQF